MKHRDILKAMSDFVLGKGFYMVLALCLLTVGVSGYYLLRNVAQPMTTAETTRPTQEETEVTMPSITKPEQVESTVPEVPDLSQIPVETARPTEVVLPEETQPEQPEPTVKATVYTWPVKGEVLRGFSVETLSLDPTLGDWRTHAGMDIAANVGTRVLAMSSGTVYEVAEDDLMGTCVTVDHGDGLFTIYCNLAQEVTVKAGDAVRTGDILGTVGESALIEREMPAHLHLELALNGKCLDPIAYLPEK